MVTRIARISLLTLLGAIIFSVAFIPHASFALTGVCCHLASDKVGAGSCNKETQNKDPYANYIEVEIPIPGITNQYICTDQATNNALPKVYGVEDLGAYIAGVYAYFVSFVGILAVVMIMYAGIRWILAAGNQSRIQGAKSILSSAVIGVVIAFCSYLLLYLLNPNTVDLSRLQKTFDTAGLTNIGVIGSQTFQTCDKLSDKNNTKLHVSNVGLACKLPNACPAGQDFVTTTKAANLGPDEVGCSNTGTIDFVGTADTGTSHVGDSCTGTRCVQGKCFLGVDQCIQAMVAGQMNSSSDIFAEEIGLAVVCNDNNLFGINTSDPGKMNLTFGAPNPIYILGPASNPDAYINIKGFIANCSSHGGIKGYMLKVGIDYYHILLDGHKSFYVDRDGRVLRTLTGARDASKFTAADFTAVKPSQLFQESELYTISNGNPLLTDVPIVDNLNINFIDYPENE